MIKIRFLAAVAACLLLAIPVAAPAQDPHPAPPLPPLLKPGRSAGVHAAQQSRTGLALVGAGAIIAVVIVAATASNGGSGSSNQVNPQNQSVATTS
jgi:hypothetical protein